VDARTVILPDPIRELGSFPVPVRFTRNLTQTITVLVVPDEASKPLVERLEAERAVREEEERKREEAAAYRAQQDARARGEFVPGDAEATGAEETEAAGDDAEGEDSEETEE
jgi:ribosomal protein L9